MRLGLGLGMGVAAGPIASFVPTDLSGITLWLRAGVGYSSGTWLDQSGAGHNFTQASGPAQPTTGTIAGQPALVFNGTSQYLSSAASAFSGQTAGEAFIVMQLDADPPATGAGGLWTFGTGASDHTPFTDGVIYSGWGSDTRKTTVDPATSMASAACIYNIRSAANAWSSHLNGTQLFTTATNSVAFPSVCVIGSGNVAGSVFHKGKIGEVLVFNRVLTSDERTSNLAYLGSLYGIAIA